PQSADVFITLGNLKVEKNLIEEAKQLFENAYKIDPAEGSVALASFYRWTEDFANSEKYLVEAIGHYPKNATLHAERGVNFAIQNQLDRAIESWQTALQIEPDLEAVQKNISMAKAQIEAERNAGPRPGPFKQNVDQPQPMQE
ncbi:MAG: hypothetical protein AB1403_16825, partial [Candidatus Riflebacteria bacterium]